MSKPTDLVAVTVVGLVRGLAGPIIAKSDPSGWCLADSSAARLELNSDIAAAACEAIVLHFGPGCC